MTDILIIGAGPAGVAAARLLALWGHDVLVMARDGGDAARLAESIPPSANKLLRVVGALDAVQSAGFLPWRGNTVWWADEPARVERFPDDSGYQVLRRDFDRCLRTLSTDAGARIESARVTDVQRVGDCWAVSTEHEGRVAVHQSRIVIDASGRAGVLARAHRLMDPDQRTVALAGSWRSHRPWPLEDDSDTLVASYAGGWAWSVPIDREVRQFTVMVDPARSDLTRGAPAREVYLSELRKVAPFTSVLAAAELADSPWGADATEYTARQYSGPGFLLAGDAASAINPLSSFGVKKALASGWLAAVAAHTALVTPGMAGEAFAFFDRRERAVAATAARQAARFATEAADRTGHSYWTARANPSDAFEAGEPDPAALARDPAVLAAFADLRARPSVRLVPGADVRIEPRAAVRGREIVMEPHVVTSAWPDGLHYLRDVDLVSLMTIAPGHRDIGAMYEAMLSTTPNVELPNLLGALSVLVANGTLRHS